MLPASDPATLWISTVVLLHLTVMRVCGGQLDLIGSSQPIVATLGGDAILPCQLMPAADAAALTLEWTRPDLEPRFVFVWRTGQELQSKKHQAFAGRTSLFTDELHNGNISLKLSDVRRSDGGTYRCFIPAQDKQTFVELLVASSAATAPILTVAGLDQGGVVLQCESAGWSPEPELLWLDAEGNLLPAGPTETVRGADGLYTVSSTVTVEKRHGSSNITCRVQQSSISQATDAHIHVPEDFYHIQATCSALTLGFAVSLSLCVASLLSVIVWKLLNIIKSRRRRRDQGDGRGERSRGDDQFSTEGEDEQLMMRDDDKVQTSADPQVLGEAEKRVKDLTEKLKNKAELQQLLQNMKTTEKELQHLRKQLENKNTELVSMRADAPYWWAWSSTKEAHQRSMKEAESHVESLKNKLQKKEKDLASQSKQFDQQRSEVITLVQDVIQQMKSHSDQLKAQQTELDTRTDELNQTKRHVDHLLAEVKQLKEKKLGNESQQLQKEETMK